MGCPCEARQRPCSQHLEETKKTRVFPKGKIPPFLPQAYDDIKTFQAETSESGLWSGPWATGRVIWTPTADLTGIRPVVDRYSITRYSMKDWREKNQQVLDMVIDTGRLKENVKCTTDRIVAGSNDQQKQSTMKLEERLKLVNSSKLELEQLIKDLRDEIVLLTETKVKLKFSLPALGMPESIAGECIDSRTNRLEQDLVNDEVEIELVKEMSMVHEARKLYQNVIKEIEKQVKVNRACKDQLELSWSDKKETCELDSINVCLKNTTPIISFHGGAVRLPDNQSSPESWGVLNVALITLAKEELSKSKRIREGAQEDLLLSTLKELRAQADKVYQALMKRIEEMDQCRQMFENELQDVLTQVSEAESQYEGLIKLRRQLQINMKVVQTRLNNRLQRPRAENCRDEPEYGLLEEAKYLEKCQTDVTKQIEEIDRTVSKLYKVRSNLEYAIMTKRKSLYVDQQRCMSYRMKYPDIVKLAGGH